MNFVSSGISSCAKQIIGERFFTFPFILVTCFISFDNIKCNFVKKKEELWRRGVVVITTAQLHSTKPELRLCAGSKPARGVSEIRDGQDL